MIDQRSDDVVLILVVDGCQAHNISTTYNDLVGIMLDFDAVHKVNQDGGSSSLVVYQSQSITTCALLYGKIEIVKDSGNCCCKQFPLSFVQFAKGYCPFAFFYSVDIAL